MSTGGQDNKSLSTEFQQSEPMLPPGVHPVSYSRTLYQMLC